MPTATHTATPTPTPRFVALPPPELLTNLVAAQAGEGFHYLPWHYVAEDTIAWLVFGWPEEDDRIYRAVFGLEDGDWALLGVEEMDGDGRPGLDEEAWR